MNQKTYIKKLLSLFPDITLVWHYNLRGKWTYAKSSDENAQYFLKRFDYPNHYIIPPSEVVIDIDTDDKNNLEYVEKELDNRLSRLQYTYSKHRNPSGKSHYHLLFNGLDKYDSYDRANLKKLILRYLCKGLIKKGKIDMQLTGKHCVRMPYGLYEKSKPKWEYKELLIDNDYFTFNDIPQTIMNEFVKEKDKITIYLTNKEDNGNLPCINYILHEDFVNAKDCRKRALFIIASYFKKEGKSSVETMDEIKRWNQYKINSYLTDIQIMNCIKSNKGTVGCRYREEFLKELGRGDLCKRCRV